MKWPTQGTGTTLRRFARVTLAAAIIAVPTSRVTLANDGDTKDGAAKPAATATDTTTGTTAATTPTAAPVGAATAEEVQELRQQLLEATKRIEQLTNAVDQLQQRLQPATTPVVATTSVAPTAPTAPTGATGTGGQREMASVGGIRLPQEDAQHKPEDLLMSTKAQGGRMAGSEGLYKGDKLKIGGYVDFRYQGPGLDDGVEIQETVDEVTDFTTDSTPFRKSGFNGSRLVLGVASAITDNLLFNSEVEYEFGGEEVEVEQAYLEYHLKKEFNLRGGIIVMPIGRFNLYHDSNLMDIVPRPLEATLVIPSTYSDSGVGAFGEFKLGKNARLSYEGYVVNGLRSDEEGEIAREAGFAESKGLNLFYDNNAQKSFVGRLALSPFLGLELGASGYRGKHDNNGFYNLSIVSGDFKYQYKDFQILGEYARNSLQRAADSPEETNARNILLGLSDGEHVDTFDYWDSTINVPLFDTAARSSDGFYFETRYRFHPQWLRDHFEDDASIAPVFRFDQANLDRSFPNFRFPLNQRRASFGISIRPTEAVSLNVAYHVSRKPDVFLRLPDGRPFPPYFTNIDANSFSMGLVWAF